MINLIVLGILTGTISGFFGVGGGMILVPMLLVVGYGMKTAIAISIIQMVFSSISGTLLNLQQNKKLLKDGVLIGIGGLLGGTLSGFLVPSIDEQYLKYLFLFIVLLAIYKVASTSVSHSNKVKKQNKIFMIFVGFIIGMIAMSIGVGGSVMLTPILVGYFYYNIKDASSLGLFFVIFSSIAGFLSLSFNSIVPYHEGIIVGIASLIGVFIGIKIKNIVHIKSYKYSILVLYFIILTMTIYKL